MDKGIEIGATYTKAQIIADMVAEAERLGVNPGYIGKRPTGISLILKGRLERIDIPRGHTGYARERALGLIQDLLEKPT